MYGCTLSALNTYCYSEQTLIITYGMSHLSFVPQYSMQFK